MPLSDEDTLSRKPVSWIAAPGLFRITLALLVILNHSLPLYFGPAAVYLFFMLSGYWVERMWVAEYSLTRQPYRTFLISRLWRLLPVYYAALVFFLCGQHFFPAPNQSLSLPPGWLGFHLVFSHVVLLGYATLPFLQKLILPVWSLDIELQFYLVAPLLLVFLSKQKYSAARKWLLAACALAGLAAFFWSNATLDGQSAGWLPMYLVFFLIGLYAARFEWRPGSALANLSLAICCAGVLACLLIPATRPIFAGYNGVAMASLNPHANVVLALLAAPYAMATVRERPSPGWHGRLDRDLGNVTYELYLLHWPLLAILKHFVGRVHSFRQIPALSATWCALGLLSWLVYRFLDRPLDRHRRAFVKARSVRAQRRPSSSAITSPQ